MNKYLLIKNGAKNLAQEFKQGYDYLACQLMSIKLT